ncbi:MAG: ethylbenzene dehydrogenase-related protein [Omnitrophica bacterium]|nr:ethylbenzene dehydrogenase-related protein [Candidatus Omnitrophota bacterium]
MKKSFIILIIAVTVAAFAGLTYYGLKHTRGVPVIFEEREKPILEVPLMAKDLYLKNGIGLSIWDGIKPQKIELLYQVMIIPWPKKVVPYVNIKAFHTGKDIYFYMEWEDSSRNYVMDIKKFSDAGAILFPLEKKPKMPSLMMGFLGKSNIWQWKASQDREYWLGKTHHKDLYVDFYYPFEEEELFIVSKEIPKSGANDLMAIRVGTITPKDEQNIQGRGFWRDGTWRVVFKRSFRALDPELDAIFEPSGKRLCAFAVWDGENGDRGGRKSISDWVELSIK